MENSSIEFAHIVDCNLGDAESCPISHFPFQNAREVCFGSIPVCGGSTLVVGGGGMFYPDVDSWIEKMSHVRKVVLWGVGLNYYYDIKHRVERTKDIIKGCFMAGIRDRSFALENGFDYVPCSSCMHEEFDMVRTPTKDIGVYEHYVHPLGLGYEKMNNRNDKSFSDVIKFLGSFKKIITNSYHGAYWARLMNREVEMRDVHSIRFNDMPTESLSECRKLNIKFYEKVKSLI